MKKALLVSVILLAFTLPAFAGPYFSLENTGLALAPKFTVGFNGDLAVLQTGPVVTGDLYLTDSDILNYKSKWDFNLDASIAWSMVKVETGFGFTYKPTTATASNWLTSFKVTGRPIDFLTLWGSVDIPVGSTDPWSLNPTVGIECRW